MPKFMIEPHFRLQEWVAEEKGYFVEAGLDYEFREFIRATGGTHTIARPARPAPSRAPVSRRDARRTSPAPATGPSMSPPRAATPSSTPMPIRWRRRASSCRPTRPFARRRTWPACLFRSATSRAAITRPSSCSSPTCRPTGSTCQFGEGMLFSRMEAFLDGKAPAAALFNGPYYFVEQLGFRQVIDTRFMMS